MVIFLLFCGVPQKTVAAIINYTDRQVRNIRERFESSNGDFPRKRKKRWRNIRADSEVYRGSPPLRTHPKKLVIDDKKIKHLSFQYYEIAQTNAALLLFTSWNWSPTKRLHHVLLLKWAMFECAFIPLPQITRQISQVRSPAIHMVFSEQIPPLLRDHFQCFFEGDSI